MALPTDIPDCYSHFESYLELESDLDLICFWCCLCVWVFGLDFGFVFRTQQVHDFCCPT